jgi:hypothetical protein
MDEQTPNAVPPGWYTDPGMVGTQRYWDGQCWTDSHAPMSPARPSHAPSAGLPDWVSVVGYLAMFFVPPVGLAIGCYHLTNNQRGAGILMCAVSVLVAGVGLVLYLQSSTAPY